MTMKWFAVWQAILAAMNTIAAGTVLTNILGPKWAGMFVLIVAAMQAGTTSYFAALHRAGVSTQNATQEA